MDKADRVLLNDDVSPDTRAILEKQLKEGVPVTASWVTCHQKRSRPQSETDGSECDDSVARNRPSGKGSNGLGTLSARWRISTEGAGTVKLPHRR